jgi:hypothetical protein
MQASRTTSTQVASELTIHLATALAMREDLGAVFVYEAAHTPQQRLTTSTPSHLNDVGETQPARTTPHAAALRCDRTPT